MSAALAATRRVAPLLAPRRAFFSFPDLAHLSPFHQPESDTHTFHERKILPYSQRQMYDVVSDVDSYRHFVPFVTASRVLRRAPPSGKNDAQQQQLEAELSVGFMGLTESYVSTVVCKPYESVEATASSSTPLFDTLITTWRFQPASPTSPHATDADIGARDALGPTLVSIDLAYAFAHPLHAQISAAFFGQVSKLMIRAFEERCLAVYGPGRR
ncbi:hypothetical protein EXIGLDRAFT_599892 [Exidia glandulosa HHB12029]|uniref:Coenzyme Q-binding protein COQ10 START domain-containing protein n=1 Tax=Exidia glandulosa HHB12029 TaxID=1314781 RepID=A0A165QMD5_EXIGL|nr:hypothetical protein EXIGLDRAFT_599892 [Exidia glandulosa HHB12029]